MGVAVTEQTCKRSQVYPEGDKVERLRTRRRHPLVGKKSGVHPRRYRRNSRRLAIDRDLGFAEVGVPAPKEVVDRAQIIGKTRIPLFVGELALGDDVEVNALDVSRKREASRELIARRGEYGGQAHSAAAVRLQKRKHGVGSITRLAILRAIAWICRIELEICVHRENAVQPRVEGRGA